MKEVKVLVVVDTQNDFHAGQLGTMEAAASVPHIVAKIDRCNDEGYIVIATKDTHGADYMDTNEGKHLPIPHCIPGTSGWDTVEAIRKSLDKCSATEVIKDRFGSFVLPGVINALASEKAGRPVVDGKDMEIVIIGWCTDICVVTNALILKTAFPEAEIIVDPNCCAGVTPEAHDAALAVMKSCQITVI